MSFRFLLLGLVLLAEVWFFRKRFTTDTLIGSGEWWVPLVRATRLAIPWALCVLGALLLIGGGRLREYLRELVETSPGHRAWPQVLVHPVAALSFFFVSEQLLGGAGEERSRAWFWAPLWAVSGSAVLLSLAWVAFPMRALGRFTARTAWTQAASFVTGTYALLGLAYIAESWPFSRELGWGTLWVSRWLLGPFVDEIVFEPQRQLLGTPEFNVAVTKYCSGYEGLSLFLVFYVVFLILWRGRLRFPNALLLLPLGMVGVWTMNAIRIVVLVLMGSHISPEIALDGFHVNAGWPSICLVSFFFVAVSTRVQYFSSSPITAAAPDTVNPTGAYLAPLLVIVATSMVAGAVTAYPQSMYPVRILVGTALLWLYRRELDLRFGRAGIPVLIGTVAFGIWVALHYVIGADPEAEDPLAWQTSRSLVYLAPWWVFRILGSVLIVPLAEELAFRGFLLRRMISPHFEDVPYSTFRWVPFLVSSLVFGALHQAWIAGTVVGMLYALASYRRGRLGDAVVAHATTNGLLAVFAAITGNWGIL